LSFTTRLQVADVDGIGWDGDPLAAPSPDRVVIDAETPPQRTYRTTGRAQTGVARIVAWKPDRVEIDVESQLGGVLVLRDIDYPGWIAEIDGIATPILRTDLLFRGVEVSSGRRRIVFRYSPFSAGNLANALRTVLRRRR
jgi:hypothetical protein